MNKQKVIAITVTFNRSNTLKDTVSALIKQDSKCLEKIIIVDNCSNSEHRENIKEIIKLDNRIDLLQLDDNYGGAGGFSFGMKYAYEKYNADWYWIMDDDAYPTENCLTKLLEKSSLDNIAYLAPIIFGITNKKYQNYHHKKFTETLKEYPVFEEYENLDAVTEIDANAFVGPLFSKNAVQKIGFPEKDLFIYGDDSEYTYRCKANGFNGYLIKDAVINHEDIVNGNNVVLPTSWWKDYYWIRNQYIFIEKYSNCTSNKIKGKLSLYKFVVGDTVRGLKIKEYNNLRILRFKTLIRALNDGRKNKIGKSINPDDYIKEINFKKNKNNQ